MRTAKYHDYTVLRIVLLIIFIILGLFIYNQFFKAPPEHVAPDNAWLVIEEATCTTEGSRCKVCTDCGERFNYETIPATGHSPMNAVQENHKDHTLTEGESFEKVQYCKDCGAECSRETVYVKGQHTPEIIHVQEDRLEPTCTEHGTYVDVTICEGCGEELGREVVVLEPNGHDYIWELVYNESDDSFALVGECEIDGTTTTVTESNGLDISRDDTVALCCLIRYIGTYTYNGKDVECSIDFPTDHHHKAYYYPDKDDYKPAAPILYEIGDPKYDAEHDEYYYDISEYPCIEYYDSTNNYWTEDGFAWGIYQCTTCKASHCSACEGTGHRFIVRIYSAEMDSRLTENE